MREVVDGVIEIPIGYVSAYAVVVDDGVVLVDTGIPGRAEKVARAVEAARRSIGDVHTILLGLFAGDAAGGRRSGRIRRSPRMVTEDRAAELASIARLGDLSFELAVFGHGRAISREAAQRFREFAALG
jgi:glyoxylase-like metal-dependent hydrolase (beta-lactamase superfamily II)